MNRRSRSRCYRFLLSTVAGFCTATLLVGSSAAQPPRSASESALVFASNRASNYPNRELYALHVDGTGRTDLSRNPAEERQPVLSPNRQLLAFVRNTGGVPSVYVMSGRGGPARLLARGAISPAWSPDGHRLAVASASKGGRGIDIVNADGSKRRRITHGSAGYSAPTWSPRGQTIAFVSHRARRTAVSFVRADGTNEHQATHPPKGMRDEDPVWAPNGGRLAFVRRGGEPCEGPNPWDSGAPRVYLIDSNGRNEGALDVSTDCSLDPAWAPDSERIAVAADRPADPLHDCCFEIELAKMDGSDAVRFGGRHSVCPDSAEPSWSPDGRRVAFVCASIDVVVLDAATGDERILTTYGGHPDCNEFFHTTAWSRDGRDVLTSSRLSCNGMDLFLMDANGRQLRQLTHTGSGELDPVWSPDGRRIAFWDEFGGISVINGDGTQRQALTGIGETPSWSPDGRRIAFSMSSRDEEGARLYVMNADGSHVGQITRDVRGDAEHLLPIWSPDGRTLAFTRCVADCDTYPSGTAYSVRVDGSRLTPLTRGVAVSSDWSSDGQRILLSRPGGIYELDLTTHRERRLGSGWGAKWSMNGSKIAFVDGRRDDIYVMNADGTRRSKLTTHPADDTTPDWRPKGR